MSDYNAIEFAKTQQLSIFNQCYIKNQVCITLSQKCHLCRLSSWTGCASTLCEHVSFLSFSSSTPKRSFHSAGRGCSALSCRRQPWSRGPSHKSVFSRLLEWERNGLFFWSLFWCFWWFSCWQHRLLQLGWSSWSIRVQALVLALLELAVRPKLESL